MQESTERNLHRAVGMSDLSALLAAAFRFPADESLATALTNGSFLADWNASWEDACGAEFSMEVASYAGGGNSVDAESCVSEGAPSNASGSAGADASEETSIPAGTNPSSFDSRFADGDEVALRREHSRIFLAPGPQVPVWPYESAFLHDAAGMTDLPNLFRTRTTVDVERQMNDAGVHPEHARTEPCDHVATELEFLSYLYAQWGEAVHQEAKAGDGSAASNGPEDSDTWRQRISAFASEHALKWMPAFFKQTNAESRIEAYRALADLGTRYLSELARDARR